MNEVKFLRVVILSIALFVSVGFGQEGPIANFTFNGDATDISGNGYNGTPSGGVTFTEPDRFGNENSAALFDGINGIIDTELQMESGDKSFSIWVKPRLEDSFGGDGHMFGGFKAWDNRFYFGYVRSADFAWAGLGDHAYTPALLDSTTNIWHHFVLVSEDTLWSVYQNNVMIGTGAWEGVNNGSNGYFSIGSASGDYSRWYFDGTLDDAQIYDRALTGSDISTLYHVGGWPHSQNTVNIDFEDVDLSAWVLTENKPGSCSQSIVQGSLNGEGEFVLHTEADDVGGNDGEHMLSFYEPSQDWMNYDLSFDFQMVNSTYNYMSMVFYYQDIDTIYNNGYRLLAAPTQNNLSFSKIVDGVWESYGTYAYEFTNNTTYHIDIRMVDENIKIYLDANLCFNIEENTFRSGAFGFGTANAGLESDRIVLYDNIRCDYSDQDLESDRVVVQAENSLVGETVKIPVVIELLSVNACRATELDFSGYAESMQFLRIDTMGTMIGGLDWAWAENEVDGNLQTAFAGSDEISGTGVFCYLEFLVTGDICSTVPLNCDYALFNDIEASDIMNGSVYIEPQPVYGDVDENGMIQALDASDILMYLVDSHDLNCQNWANADVDQSDTVDAMDASLILQFVVDSIDSLPVMPDAPEFLARGSIGMEAVGAINGEDLLIPLVLTHGDNIYSFQGEFTYNTDHMTFVGVENAFEGFTDVVASDNGLGRVKFASYRARDGGAADGVFAQLRFTEVELNLNEETEVNFEQFKFNGNLNLNVGSQAIVSIESNVEVPSQYTLSQNYPNPFNPTTTIRYGLPDPSDVSFTIYDVVGREVATVVQAHQVAGWHSVKWNGVDYSGTPVSTGIYFARLKAGSHAEVIKMTYLR